ncbi:MAG TPA: alpha-hydroxy acid oxidase [Candidatus Eisenbacteria bacterium]|nr:alpha-hydroxy acid oxidase [Candidatus Eisenbacteria bacterium]
MEELRPVNVQELEPLARERITETAYAYLTGGSGDEHSLRWNVEAWSRIRLAPRFLVDVGAIDTRLTLLGHRLDHPVLLAPAAAHRLFHPEGELETLRGAAAADALYVQSTMATVGVEEVGAAATSPWWFQLYIQRDRGFTRELVARAEAAGASALVLTIDLPVLGARDTDRRNSLGLPPGVEYVNLRGLAIEPDTAPPERRVYNQHLDPTVTWDDLDWLRSLTRLPVLAKGVLRPDDALRCLDHGVAGLVVSNHGARNLDTVPPTAEVLPHVVDAVAGRVPVLVDGGLRRGTDIAKALMLGATAVLVGRPYVWGLAAYGADGVKLVTDLLRTELQMAMGLLGAPTLADLTPDLIWH